MNPLWILLFCIVSVSAKIKESIDEEEDEDEGSGLDEEDYEVVSGDNSKGKNDDIVFGDEDLDVLKSQDHEHLYEYYNEFYEEDYKEDLVTVQSPPETESSEIQWIPIVILSVFLILCILMVIGCICRRSMMTKKRKKPVMPFSVTDPRKCFEDSSPIIKNTYHRVPSCTKELLLSDDFAKKSSLSS